MVLRSSGDGFRSGAPDGDAQLSQMDWGLWGRGQATSVIANWIARGSGQHCGRQHAQ